MADIVPCSPTRLTKIGAGSVVVTVSNIRAASVSSRRVNRVLGPTKGGRMLLAVNGLTGPTGRILIGGRYGGKGTVARRRLTATFSVCDLRAADRQRFIYPFGAAIATSPMSLKGFGAFTFSTVSRGGDGLRATVGRDVRGRLAGGKVAISASHPSVVMRAFCFFSGGPGCGKTGGVLIRGRPVCHCGFGRDGVRAFPFLGSVSTRTRTRCLLRFNFHLVSRHSMPNHVL